MIRDVPLSRRNSVVKMRGSKTKDKKEMDKEAFDRHCWRRSQIDLHRQAFAGNGFADTHSICITRKQFFIRNHCTLKAQNPPTDTAHNTLVNECTSHVYFLLVHVGHHLNECQTIHFWLWEMFWCVVFGQL